MMVLNVEGAAPPITAVARKWEKPTFFCRCGRTPVNMNGGEVLRIVDALHREKGIDKELIFESIEQALSLAAKKHLNTKEQPVVRIDRQKGEITAFDGDQAI